MLPVATTTLILELPRFEGRDEIAEAIEDMNASGLETV